MNSISSRPMTLQPLSVPLTISKYSCCYLPKHTTIYNIVMPKNTKTKEKNFLIDLQTAHYKDVSFFTIPMVNRQCKKTENVLVSFVCPSLAEYVKNDIVSNTELSPQVYPTTIKDYSYHATLLKIPLVTIVNWMCPVEGCKEKEKDQYFEVFYTLRYLTDVEDYAID